MYAKVSVMSGWPALLVHRTSQSCAEAAAGVSVLRAAQWATACDVWRHVSRQSHWSGLDSGWIESRKMGFHANPNGCRSTGMCSTCKILQNISTYIQHITYMLKSCVAYFSTTWMWSRKIFTWLSARHRTPWVSRIFSATPLVVADFVEFLEVKPSQLSHPSKLRRPAWRTSCWMRCCSRPSSPAIIRRSALSSCAARRSQLPACGAAEEFVKSTSMVFHFFRNECL